MSSFGIFGKGNGLSNSKSYLVKLKDNFRAEHFSFCSEYGCYLTERKRHVSLIDRPFNPNQIKSIILSDPEFIQIIETHTLVPELLPEFALFMRKLLVEQFGDKILEKAKPELMQAMGTQLENNSAVGIAVKDTIEQLGFIRFNK